VRRAGRKVTPALTWALAWALAWGTPLGAQEGGGASGEALDAVERAMLDGAFGEARERMAAWWEAASQSADRERLQRAIWLRARLTVEPDEAERLYRQLVLEYPGGPWSDQALLRLASGAQAQGDSEAEARYLQILVRDYPASPHRVEARARLARASAPAAAAPAPATTRAAPEPRVEPEVEPAAPVRAEAPVSARPAAVPPAQAAPHTVQLGAFGSRAAAEALAGELTRAGMEVRLVQVEGSPLYRVRTGGWTEPAEAESARDALRARGFEAIVSADRDRERPAAPGA
jgi:hypothetical protein